MTQATLLDRPAPAPAQPLRRGAKGAAALVVRGDDGTTRLADLYQAAPLRFLFPGTTDAAEPMQAMLVNTAGGLVGGDRLSVTVEAGEAARLQVMAQAAEKLYRSAGPDVIWDVTLKTAPGAWLEWLPQETIVFDGARLRRRTSLDLAPDSQCLAGEMLIFGRAAKGETVTHGLLRDAWEVRIDGRLRWADALHVDSDIPAVLTTTSGFQGAHSCATLVAHCSNAVAARDALRALPPPPDTVRFAATVIEGLLIARWLARDPLALRQHYAEAWGALRRLQGGFQGRLPRLWHV